MVTAAGHWRYLIGGDDCPFNDSGWYSSDKLRKIKKQKQNWMLEFTKLLIRLHSHGQINKNVKFSLGRN